MRNYGGMMYEIGNDRSWKMRANMTVRPIRGGAHDSGNYKSLHFCYLIEFKQRMRNMVSSARQV